MAGKGAGRKTLQELYGLTDAAAIARYAQLKKEYTEKHDGQCGAAAESVIGSIAYLDQLLRRARGGLAMTTMEASPRGGQREKKELSQVLRLSRTQVALMQSIGLIRGGKQAAGSDAEDDAPEEEELDY